MTTTPDWRQWTNAVAAGISRVPDADLARAADVLRRSLLVLTAGNGGSAALASHMAQAISKPGYAAGGGFAAVCLTDAIPALTAHANDGGWSDALAECARPFLDAVQNAALVAISSSGASPNVVALAEMARERKLPVVALTGHDGGQLRTLATVSIHVDSRDYEVIEPVHDALLHRIQFHIRGREDVR